jgi:enamine deaminase RidA (YjgF/YER057c/UK114 family)
VLEKQVGLLKEAGAAIDDVISVKVYSTDMKATLDIGKAFSEIFFDIKPLFTVVGTNALNRPTQVVEIEITAIY